MWHWQHKNEYPKIVLWAKLAGISCVLHVCIVGYLLMWYHDHDAYHITLHTSRISSETPVVFLPLYKRMQKPVNTTRTTSAQQTPHSASKTTSPTVRSTPSVRKTTTLIPSTKDTQKSQKKQSVKKTKKQTTSAKKTAEKTVSKTTHQHHTQTSTEKKTHPASPKTKNVQPKAAQSQAIEQNEIAHQESTSPVKQETTSASTASSAIATNSNDDPQPVYVGQEEWYALQIQRAIEDELTQHWRVPHGLSSDLSCQIAVTVDWQGNVQQVRVAQSSGVLAYDISARSAATHMQLPALARGKEFIITFKQ